MAAHHDMTADLCATRGTDAEGLVRKGIRLALVVVGLLCAQACGGSGDLWFSGIQWTVKTGSAGPGPNLWSDDAKSVWVDSQGRLHLKIRKIKGKWHCAEVVSQAGFGYGEYRFELSTDVEAMDRNAVLGLFTYLDDQNEVDIEMSRWGDANNPSGNYVIQPFSNPGNQHAFELGLQGDHSTHKFRWMPDRIDFQSIHGHYATPPTPAHGIQVWSYAGADVPAAGGERLHLNLWLFRGEAPANKREIEVIVNQVVVRPPLTLTTAPSPDGTRTLTVSGGGAGDPVVVMAGVDDPTDPLVRGVFDGQGSLQMAWTPDPALSGSTRTLEALSTHSSGAPLLSNRIVVPVP